MGPATAPGQPPASNPNSMSRGTTRWRAILAGALVAASVLATPLPAGAYSALAHEAVIDAAWDGSISRHCARGFTRLRMISSAHARLCTAEASFRTSGDHPFSSRFFGDLTHYVRSADFVEALVKESADVTDTRSPSGRSRTMRPTTEAIRSR